MGLLDNLFKSKYSIRDILNIDQNRINRSSELTVKLIAVYSRVQQETVWDNIKKFFNRNKSTMNVYYKILKYKVKSNSGSEYTVVIELQPSFDYNIFLTNPIKVYCNCYDFRYRSAYNLNKHNSLFLNNKVKTDLSKALLEPPRKVTTSPCCKHVYACLQDLYNNYDNVKNYI
jgi:hypothetical protein